MLLQDKNAVIYGAAGSIGGNVARAFAREGARVFLAGRTLDKLNRVADEIRRAGGVAETGVVDACDSESVQHHMDAVIQRAGRIDISFNAVWIRGDLQGTPLLEMSCDNFTTPVLAGVKTHFLTATAAGRYMVQQKSGVILTLSSSASVLSGRESRHHVTGGFATACAAIEAFTRSLAGELGQQGIRVICLRPNAIPETWGDPDHPNRVYMENGTTLGRLPTLNEVANAAVMMASDLASLMTGTVADLTCGS